MRTRDDLLGAALALSPEQCERLAEELQVSVAHNRGHDTTAIVPDSKMTAELERRIATLDRGDAARLA